MSEKPKFKTFELIWDGKVCPVTKNSHGALSRADRGWMVDNYRICKFTDNPNFPSGGCDLYDFSCDERGNRKYAIGRLEE